MTYLPQRPSGARGPGEGAREGGEAHGDDGAEGMGREGGRALVFGLRSFGDRGGGRRTDERDGGWRNGGGGGGRGSV